MTVSGHPVVVIETKGPGEDIDSAYREARLYASELNALYPAATNPVKYIIAITGEQLVAGNSDTSDYRYKLTNTSLNPSNEQYINFISEFSYVSLKENLEKSLLEQDKGSYRALNFIGGQNAQNEEVGENEFGSQLALEFSSIFNPSTRDDRVRVG